MAQACFSNLSHTAIKASLPFLPLAMEAVIQGFTGRVGLFGREAAHEQLAANHPAAHARDAGLAPHTRVRTVLAGAQACFSRRLPVCLGLGKLFGKEQQHRGRFAANTGNGAQQGHLPGVVLLQQADQFRSSTWICASKRPSAWRKCCSAWPSYGSGGIKLL